MFPGIVAGSCIAYLLLQSNAYVGYMCKTNIILNLFNYVEIKNKIIINMHTT